MISKQKSLCFSGHRAEKLPKSKEKLKLIELALYEEIDKSISDGTDTFIMGACYGFDLMAATQVLLRKRVFKPTDPKEIKLIAVVPFEDQASKWNKHYRNLYFTTLELCDEVITLNTHYNSGCYYERNCYMVDNCSKMICYYDGSDAKSLCGTGTGYTVNYAKKTGMTIINLCEKNHYKSKCL